MLRYLENLSQSQAELLLKAPILVGILMAGADGEIDRTEINRALQVAQDKATGADENVARFFAFASEDFEDKFKVILQSYASDSHIRNKAITEELRMLNDIWPLLPLQTAGSLYTSLLEMAQRIASSSGGIMGLGRVSEEEKEFVNLPMINNPTKN